ncbi:endo alpha-1,4 polygalactosaminidase [Pandoraea sp.]|uniref:endo alpha-1,4 polygalactosaminidase n=1 Tax=Pandoraea sp. TaxID=1883445 RepID=UPI00120953B8|nr:endo alpha-1,4 polygalactosaminidase [Pandoraea sp.]TAL53282.1 MAG: hypothetical protein EPN80_16040 [Pandoraea sp.]TAM16649.1 MAG: hypothetical protein EPN65_13785 [Pandoraea sp.]
MREPRPAAAPPFSAGRAARRARAGWRPLLAGLMASLCLGKAIAAPAPLPWSIAFYYGDSPPLAQLAEFDLAVIEPDSGFDPTAFPALPTQWFAYVSVGEVDPSRSYYAQIPKRWLIGRNGEWHASVVDPAAPGWPAFFVAHVIDPLWKQGYRGFFLDTLDSYQLVAKTDVQRERDRAGLVALIEAIHRRYPTARLILNRGFELLPEVHDAVFAVAFESLYQGWSEAAGRYVEVPQDDRQWLLGQADLIRQRYGLPVISIDYCAPADAECASRTVARIKALGIVPYVGDGHLQTVNPASAN